MFGIEPKSTNFGNNDAMQMQQKQQRSSKTTALN
jgi:hypothetical protein